jgi:predicted transcriptional regulator
MSNAETARLLWVTPATIRKHLENIYGKLGVRSRTAALAKLGPRVVGEYQATDVADAPRSKSVNDSGSAEIGPGVSAKT